MTGATAPGRLPVGKRRRVAILPTTSLGRRAVWLAVAAVVLMAAWSILPGGAGPSFACGIAGGVAAVVAVLRHRERALTVFAAILPLVWVVVFVLAELLIWHD